MTDEAMLTELQGLLERATAAPWRVAGYGADDDEFFIAGSPGRSDVACAYTLNDRALVIALRNAAPRLLELARLGAAIEQQTADQREARKRRKEAKRG